MGDHLKRRRYELGLHQKDVAEQLRVNEFTVCGWENNKKAPAVRYPQLRWEILHYMSASPSHESDPFSGGVITLTEHAINGYDAEHVQ